MKTRYVEYVSSKHKIINYVHPSKNEKSMKLTLNSYEGLHKNINVHLNKYNKISDGIDIPKMTPKKQLSNCLKYNK